jgi:hypothetical protein
MTLPDVNSIF